MNPRLFSKYVGVFLLIFILAAPAGIVFAAGSGQNDAGLGRDAPDDRGSASTLASGRYSGQLVASTDLNDWYKFDTSLSSGAMVADIVLVDVPTNRGYAVELWREGTGANPQDQLVSTGRGTNGVHSIHWSLQQEGRWFIRVYTPTGLGNSGTTGSYELTFVHHSENDAGNNRDWGTTIGTAKSVGTIADGNTAGPFLGELVSGDEGDMYKFDFPAETSSPVLVTLSYGSDARLTLVLNPQVGSPLTQPVVHNGDGYTTAYFTPTTGSSKNWYALVKNQAESGVANNSASAQYTLMFRMKPAASAPDGSAHTEAPAVKENAAPLSQGLFVGEFSTSTESVDYYKLANVAVGQTIRVGVGSYTMDTNRPKIKLELIDTADDPRASIVPCQEAAGATFSVPTGKAGNWYLRVSEVGGTSACSPSVLPRSGSYAISYELVDQADAGLTGDAPQGISGDSALPEGFLLPGWTDGGDVSDTFNLGSLQGGTVVRAAVSTAARNVDFRLQLYSNSGALIAGADSVDGRARIQSAVGTSGTYHLKIEQTTRSWHDLAPAHYWFYAELGDNTNPTAVTLNAPDPVLDVHATSVHLNWSKTVDSDFASYEVYWSTNAAFTPATSSRHETIGTASNTDTDATGLSANTQYTFLIRVVDQSGLVADSNRRTVTTKPTNVGNRAPTLSDGGVDPDTGTSSTVFTFSVTYDDDDNDAPTEHRVVIGGVLSDMTPEGSSFSSGVRYKYTTTLPPSHRNFHFEFSDGQVDVRDPPTGEYDGATVTDQGNHPPTADATATPTSGKAPLNVHFDVTASDPDGDALSYSWDFDNSNGIQSEAATKSPSKTYSQPGTYTATVSVKDSHNVEATDSVTILVTGAQNKPPTLDIEATPSEGSTPLTVTFDSGATDSDGTIVGYKWDFNNANGVTVESTEAKPSKTYTEAGSYVVTVTVKDNGSAETTGTVTVVVRSGNNVPPSVVASASPSSGGAPLTVTFTAQASDADGDVVTVTWDFDSKNGVQNEATGLSVTHTYEVGGVYTVTAVARDAKGATATGTVTINAFGGNGTGSGVQITASPREGKAPLHVNFEADTSDLKGGTAQSFDWDFGDGSAHGAGRVVSHDYAKPGSYEVRLNVTDEHGVVYESTIVVRVTKGGGSPGLAPIMILGAVLAVAFVLRRRLGT